MVCHLTKLAINQADCKQPDHINAKEQMEQRNGKQGGDPIKAASAMYELATQNDPPLRVVLGSDAYQVSLLGTSAMTRLILSDF